MDDWGEHLLDAIPFSLGRVCNAVFLGGFGSVIPAALVSGSGGDGAGFHEARFAAIVAGIIVLAVIVAVLTDPRRTPDRHEPPEA